MRLIRIYQLTVAPWIPPCCRFTPSCSHYAMEALAVHGAWRGMWLSCLRLLRCQPFCRGGYDPVPPGRTDGGAERGRKTGCPSGAASRRRFK